MPKRTELMKVYKENAEEYLYGFIDNPIDLNPNDEIKTLLINFLLFKALYLLINLTKIMIFSKHLKKNK